MSIRIPNINCIHYKRGKCIARPRKFFGIFNISCIELKELNCTIKEKYPKPPPPPPPPKKVISEGLTEGSVRGGMRNSLKETNVRPKAPPPAPKKRRSQRKELKSEKLINTDVSITIYSSRRR